jgi:hypothetical protein
MGKPIVHCLALVAPGVAGLASGALDPAAAPDG